MIKLSKSMDILDLIFWNEFQNFDWVKNYKKEPRLVNYTRKSFYENIFFKFLSMEKIRLTRFYFSLIYCFKNIFYKNRFYHKFTWYKKYHKQAKKSRRRKIGIEIENFNKFKQKKIDKIKKEKINTGINLFLPLVNLKFLELNEPRIYLKENDIFVEKVISKKSIFLNVLMQNFFKSKHLAKIKTINKNPSKNLNSNKKKKFEKETDYKLGNVIRKCIHLFWNKNCENFLVLKIKEIKNTLKKINYFNKVLKLKKFLDLETFSTPSLIKIKNLTLYKRNWIKRVEYPNLTVFLFCNCKRGFVNEYGNKLFY